MKLFFQAWLVALFALATPTAQAQTSTSVSADAAIRFNDQLTDISDSLYARGQAWGSRFNEAYQTKNFASLKTVRESMERFVNTSIAKVKAMPDVSNSKPYRLAMIQYLEFEKRMIGEAFKPLESLTSSSSQEQIKAALEKLRSLSEGESTELGRVIAEQQAYAKANGFSIQSDGETETAE